MQRLTVSLLLLMVILLMPHCQPLLHELFAALGVDTDAQWIAGRCGLIAETFPIWWNNRMVEFRRYSDESCAE